MPTWGPFAHIPDGEIGDVEIALARVAINEFAGRAAPVVGRMVSLVGKTSERRSRVAGPIADDVADIALEVWRETFGADPDWERGSFAQAVIEVIEYQARGPAFHFGDVSLKELVIAHVFDLVVAQMEIQIVGGRRDAMAYRRSLTPDTAGRDRLILRGARPFTGASGEVAPSATRGP